MQVNKNNSRTKVEKTKCKFETDEKRCTCEIWDRESCSQKSIKRGFSNCVYIRKKNIGSE